MNPAPALTMAAEKGPGSDVTAERGSSSASLSPSAATSTSTTTITPRCPYYPQPDEGLQQGSEQPTPARDRGLGTPRRQFVAIRQAELREHPCDVRLDGLGADPEAHRDLGVCPALAQFLEDALLGGREDARVPWSPTPIPLHTRIVAHNWGRFRHPIGFEACPAHDPARGPAGMSPLSRASPVRGLA